MLAQMRPASAQLPPFPNLASNISRTGRKQGLKRNLAGPPARKILKCRNVINNEAIGIDSTLKRLRIQMAFADSSRALGIPDAKIEIQRYAVIGGK
jgi:hypothetical protein